MQRTDLQSAVSRFLERFTPPRGIAGNPEAMVDEAGQIAQAFSRLAPAGDLDGWWREASDELIRRMKSRAWPLVSEVEAACRAVNERAGAGSSHADSMAEAAALDRMEAWFRRFKSQMPGHGKPARTAELIRRGVLASEREARFHGFDLGASQSARALDQQPCRAETDHHERVTADLRALSERIGWNKADAIKLRDSIKPSPAFDHAGGF